MNPDDMLRRGRLIASNLELGNVHGMNAIFREIEKEVKLELMDHLKEQFQNEFNQYGRSIATELDTIRMAIEEKEWPDEH